jgi:hypothetical protein
MAKTTAAIFLALMGLLCLGLVGGCEKQEGERAGTVRNQEAKANDLVGAVIACVRASL